MRYKVPRPPTSVVQSEEIVGWKTVLTLVRYKSDNNQRSFRLKVQENDLLMLNP